MLNWLGQGLKRSGDLYDCWEDPISLPEGLPPVARLEQDMIPEVLEWMDYGYCREDANSSRLFRCIRYCNFSSLIGTENWNIA